MTTKRIRLFILVFSIAISATLSCGRLTSAQTGSVDSKRPGLGYSEAPFELIQNAEAATGATALAAVRAASAATEPIHLDKVVVVDDYALMAVTYNYIGVSAIARKQDRGWQFVCRAGGLMNPQELTERCSVPSATSESLYADFLEAPSP